MGRSRIYSQRWMYFSTLTVCSSNLAMSLAAAWTSPTLANLLADSRSGIGKKEAAILDILLPAGAAVSGVVAGPILDRIGRKHSMNLGGVFFLISWSILSYSRGLFEMYLARFTAGLAVGTLYLASGIYVAEVAPSDVRQMLFAVCSVFTNMGFLVEYCLGPYISYDALVLVSVTPSVIFQVCVPFILESPYYLASKGYYNEAQSILVTLRGRDEVAAEMKAIQEAVGESEKSTWGELWSGSNRRALGLACGAMVVKQLTGGWAITSYAGPLMAGGGLPAALASAVLGATKLVTSAVTIFLVFKFGIKRLVILSLLGIAAAHVCLLVYFILHNNMGYSMEGLLWVPLVALILFFVFTDFGIGPFPSFIGSELFSHKAKGAGTAIALTIGHISAFLTIFLFTSVDFVITLSVFTTCTAISIPFIASYLIDTSGKSLAEIQKGLPPQETENHI